MKIGIVGKGHSGSALGKGLTSAGHEIKYGHRDPIENVEDAAKFGELIIVAVPFSQLKNVAKELDSLANGKTVIDVTNAVAKEGGLAIGFTTSAAEELQKMLPKARVVKAFNYVFAQNMPTGKLGDKTLTAFIAGDDSSAKKEAMMLAKDIGFSPVDVGPLSSARYLEPLGMLLMTMAFDVGMGKDIGFKLVTD